MNTEPAGPRGQGQAVRSPSAAGPPPTLPAHSFSPTPSSLLLATPWSMKPLASPEQATLAFAPVWWAAAPAAAGRSSVAQGHSNGLPAAIKAPAQEAAGAVRNGSLQDAKAFGMHEAGSSGAGPRAQPAAGLDERGSEEAPGAADGSAPLEPILRALEMLGVKSQQGQQQVSPLLQPELPVPPLPPRLPSGRGGHTGGARGLEPASHIRSPPSGTAVEPTNPFGSGSLVGSGGSSGQRTPHAEVPAASPFSTPALAGRVQVVPSPAEPSPLTLPANAAASAVEKASAPAAAARSRRRRKQQQQQQQAVARPPKPSKSNQAKRRREQQGGEKEPRKRQRQRISKAATTAEPAEAQQPPEEGPTTPSALPSDPCLPVYESGSTKGTFYYIFGRSLLFELPPPTPPLELPNLHTAATVPAAQLGGAVVAAAPPSLQQASGQHPPVVAARQQAVVASDEAAVPPAGEAEAGAAQKRKRQRQRSRAGKGRDEAAETEAGAKFAPFAVSPPADNKEAPFSMRSMKFKGVYRMPNGRWRAQFTHRNKVIQIGMYDSEEEAARAWDRAAIQYRGLGTKINIPVSQATMAEWAKEKPVGWSLFYDDNDQPLPQPLAGAALQAKQRELQQKAAADSKGKQGGKAAVAAQAGSSIGAATGSKRAAGRQQGGKAACAAASTKSAAIVKQEEQDAASSPPSSPKAAGGARTIHEAAHPAAASARIAASPQPRPKVAAAGRSLAASAPAASLAAARTAVAGPAEEGPAALLPTTAEAEAAAVLAGVGAAVQQSAASSLPAMRTSASGPPTSSLPTAQLVSRTALDPSSLINGQPAVVVSQVQPMMVTSQRLLPSSSKQEAQAGATSSHSKKQARRIPPKPTVSAEPKAVRQRNGAAKQTRAEGGGPAPAQAVAAAGGRVQRAQRARRPAVRSLQTLSGSDSSEAEGEVPGAASRARRGGSARQRSGLQRGLDSSLIAAVAAAEAADAAAAARQNGAFSLLPPVATGAPAAAAAAAELGTPTGAGAASTPLSPGRPPHRSRKKAAHPAAEAFAFSPLLEIEVPAPLHGNMETEEEGWGGEQGRAADEEWGPGVGCRRKRRGRSGQPRGLQGSPATASAPAQPPPLTMKLRRWSAKRQRTTPELH